MTIIPMPMFVNSSGGDGNINPNALLAMFIVFHFVVVLYFVGRMILYFLKKKKQFADDGDNIKFLDYMFNPMYDVKENGWLFGDYVISMTVVYVSLAIVDGISLFFLLTDIVSKMLGGK